MTDVKNYGAIGDGSTDDTSSLLNAFSDGVYYFPPGLYKIKSASVISQLAKSDGPGVITFNGLSFPASKTIDNCVYQVSVPEMFPTIQAAIDFFTFKRAANNAWFRIQVDNGQYNIKNIVSKVSDWRSLQIVGNESNPDDCQLIVDTTLNGCGFIFENGFGAAIINGFSLIGSGAWLNTGVWQDQGYGSGVICQNGSQVHLGPAMKFDKIYYGVRSKFGSHIQCDAGVIVTNAGDCGFHAYGATISANGCKAYNCSHTNGENLGFGFCAESGGFIECERSEAWGSLLAGFYSLGNASMWAHACKSHGNKYGFYALNGGYLEANGLSDSDDDKSNAYDNQIGYYSVNGGIMQTKRTMANNSVQDYKVDNGGIQI